MSRERNSEKRTGEITQPCFRPLVVVTHLLLMSFGPLTRSLVLRVRGPKRPQVLLPSTQGIGNFRDAMVQFCDMD